MTTNFQAITSALKAHAICRAYRQGEGNCRGTVAWWLRARLRGKDIWTGNFTIEDDNLFPGVTSYSAKETTDDWGDGEPYTLIDKGLQKSRALKRRLVTEPDVINYVTAGTRADKPNKANKEIATLIRETDWNTISFPPVDKQDAANLLDSFKYTARLNGAAYYRFETYTAQKHAIGLDATSSNSVVLYFDPNLGEFQFNDIAALSTWWQAAYANRERGMEAFGYFKDTFRFLTFRKNS